MSETRTMTLPPVLPPKSHEIVRPTVSILSIAPTLSSSSSSSSSSETSTSETGATVYIPVNSTKINSQQTWQSTIKTDIQTPPANNDTQQSSKLTTENKQQPPAHVVKIQINPENEKNTRVISTVHLNKFENNDIINQNNNNNNKINNNQIKEDNKAIKCVRINVLNNVNKEDEIVETSDLTISNLQVKKSTVMNNDDCGQQQQIVTNDINRTNTCFYYSTLQNGMNNNMLMMMTSGQCSPSDTLDSGTCSDLDSTPPPLPKKIINNKKTSTILLGCNNNNCENNKHMRTGSLTSSGADVDSDDNESNISCDSLNGREIGKIHCNKIIDKVLEATVDQLGHVTVNVNDDNNNFNNNNSINFNDKDRTSIEEDDDDDLEENVIENKKINDNNKCESIEDNSSPCISPSQSVTSSLSKSSSTPRVRSPNPLVNGQQQNITSPIVKEYTYEERKQEKNKIINDNYFNDNNNINKCVDEKKFVYDDDKFYKFHINEFDNNNGDDVKRKNDYEADEYFAGYKILDREAIRSSKGTVRGVKNRVRAGIATFLQNPSSKNYKQRDAGKVVVYTTSMRVVRKTAIACVKMMGILGTHMVDYEERNLFTSREFQTELKERLDSETVDVPQLFIDGQYIGDADAVERLNESGELRPMLKPYKCPGKRQVCGFCGGAGAVPCIVCNGSKKSPKWNTFMNEFVALRCMKCDEVGLIRCQYCGASDRS